MCKNCKDSPVADAFRDLLVNALVERAVQAHSGPLAQAFNDSDDQENVAAIIVVMKDGKISVNRRPDTTQEDVRKALKPLAKKEYWQNAEEAQVYVAVAEPVST